MDFGLVGMDGLVGSDTPTAPTKIAIASDPESKLKLYGSGFLKQERSCTTNEDDWRCSKLAKTERNSIFSDVQQNQQMLSFSSPKMEDKCSPNVTFPYFHLTSPPFSRNSVTGYRNGVFPAATMHGVFAGARGPFTPSQWMELEQQALIYKYLTANMPIPSHLLFPTRKAYDSVDFSGFPGGYFRPNNLGWGTFHLGFSNNTDPEPGRCRRTDGKKWRCARDAVADQKYCERHMNRGRHRSRKPVEGQSGHSAAVTNNSSKLMLPASSSTVVGPNSGAGASGSLTITPQPHISNYQAGGGSNLSTPAPLNRNPFEEASRNDFGGVSTDSLLNPSLKGSSLMNCTNLGSSQEIDSQRSFRQFMDDWPKAQSEVDVQSERTQLSISVPLAASDLMSSTSSPNNNEKVTLSPLILSREFGPIQMGLGVGTVINEPNHRQTNWIPISWENSMGGPLGEVLHSTGNNSTADCKNSSPLNLMTEGWEHSSSLGSSPTGVLQRTAFGSLSNSSAGSSPRTENNRTHEGGNLGNELRGSTIVYSSLPAI